VATDPSESGVDQDYDTWEHREASKKLTAVHTNQVFVQPMADGLLRVSFGEVLDDEAQYHTALIMTARNALLFGDLIARTAAAMLNPPPIVQAPTTAGVGDVSE
jgi:hypothetical protein